MNLNIGQPGALLLHAYLHAPSLFFVFNAAVTTANLPDMSEPDSFLTATDGSFQDVVHEDQVLTAADLSSAETDTKSCSGDS